MSNFYIQFENGIVKESEEDSGYIITVNGVNVTGDLFLTEELAYSALFRLQELA